MTLAKRKAAAATHPPMLACPAVILQDLARSGLPWAGIWPYVQAYNPHPAPPLLRTALPQLNANDADAVLLFQYHTFNTDGTLRPLPYEQYARARVYWRTASGFAAHQTKDTRAKYLQRPDTPVYVYPAPTVDWTLYWANPERALYVVEGEKKALAMAQAGLYAIALGGVYNYAPGRHGGAASGLLLCPDLERAAKGRLVYIIYDVDAGHTTLKPDVSRAAETLASRLMDIGADPRVVVYRRPPAVPVTTKWAVDDWLQTLPPSTKPEDIGALCLEHSMDHPAARKLWTIAEDHAYVRNLDLVITLSTRHLSPIVNFRNEYGTSQVLMPRLVVNRQTSQPTTRPEPMLTCDAFMRWGARPEVADLEYCPGVDAVIMPNGNANTWPGWASVPRAYPSAAAALRDIAIFTDALRHLHGDEDCQFMFLWYLWPLAHPQRNKQFTVPVLQSEAEGVGKSVIPTLIGEHCYGPGYSLLQAGALRNERLEFAKQCMFLLLDDMKSLAPHQADINSLVTAKSLRVDEKYIRSYNIRNVLNLVITTNYTQPMKVTAETRRFFFPYIVNTKDKARWAALVQWFEHEDGGGRLLGAANALRDAGAFAQYDPTDEAPHTAKRDEMQELNVSEADKWVRDELDPRVLGDIVLFEHLHNEFNRAMGDLPAVERTRNVLARALHTTGRAMGMEKRALTLLVGSQRTTKMAYAIANGPIWRGRPHADWVDALNSGPVGRGRKGKNSYKTGT